MLVDGREPVFFEATPAETGEVLDEMQSIVLKQVNESASRTQQHRCCILTTACCEAVGLPDDCFELTALRRCRDLVLLRMPYGPRDVARYYALAPAILESIRRNGRERELLRLYFTHILPCAVLAWLAARRLPRLLYSDMITRLGRGL